jgi:hypothetical protein
MKSIFFKEKKMNKTIFILICYLNIINYDIKSGMQQNAKIELMNELNAKANPDAISYKDIITSKNLKKEALLADKKAQEEALQIFKQNAEKNALIAAEAQKNALKTKLKKYNTNIKTGIALGFAQWLILQGADIAWMSLDKSEKDNLLKKYYSYEGSSDTEFDNNFTDIDYINDKEFTSQKNKDEIYNKIRALRKKFITEKEYKGPDDTEFDNNFNDIDYIDNREFTSQKNKDEFYNEITSQKNKDEFYNTITTLLNKKEYEGPDDTEFDKNLNDIDYIDNREFTSPKNKDEFYNTITTLLNEKEYEGPDDTEFDKNLNDIDYIDNREFTSPKNKEIANNELQKLTNSFNKGKHTIANYIRKLRGKKSIEIEEKKQKLREIQAAYTEEEALKKAEIEYQTYVKNRKNRNPVDENDTYNFEERYQEELGKLGRTKEYIVNNPYKTTLGIAGTLLSAVAIKYAYKKYQANKKSKKK